MFLIVSGILFGIASLRRSNVAWVFWWLAVVCGGLAWIDGEWNPALAGVYLLLVVARAQALLSAIVGLRSARLLWLVAAPIALAVGQAGCDGNLDYRLPRSSGEFLLQLTVGVWVGYAALLVFWLLGTDKLSDPERCAGCGYAKRGLPTTVCPECGLADPVGP